MTQFPIGYSTALVGAGAMGVGVAVLMGFFVAAACAYMAGLVGATPWRQQVALFLGCVVGALVIAPVLNLLYEAYGFPGALLRLDMDPGQALAAPQAALMTTIAQGIFGKIVLGNKNN